MPRKSYYDKHKDQLSLDRKEYYKEHKSKENTIRSHSRIVPRTSNSMVACTTSVFYTSKIMKKYYSTIVWNQIVDGKKYPTYQKELGAYRVKLLRDEYRKIGYRVYTFPVECNGTDILAESDTEILAIESLNWNHTSYLGIDRLNNMIRNFDILESMLQIAGSRKEFRRILVCTYRENLDRVMARLIETKIEWKYRSPQDIPDNFMWNEKND